MSKPIRSSDFFVAGGTLRPDAPSYVERVTDKELLQLIQEGHYCYVLTPRQMGKSSLMTRTARRLREDGIRTVIIDLTEIGTVDIDAWYLGLLTEVTRVLKIRMNLANWWQENSSIGQVQRFSSFLRDIVLPHVDGKLVIFIDEIDGTLNLDFRDDFFAAIRALYNGRTRTEILENLSFVLLGVASPTELIADPARTPFNIGRRVNLDLFSFDDAGVLIEGLELSYPQQGEKIFNRIYHWTNGHPYLTQKLCQTVENSDETDWTDKKIDDLVQNLFWGTNTITDDHLKNVQDKVLMHPDRRNLLNLYRKVYRGSKVKVDDQSPLQNTLRLSGLVAVKDQYLYVRNEIYKKVFNIGWVREHTAINWTAILASIAIIVAVFAIGLILFDNFVAIQVTNDIASIFESEDECEQLTAFSRIFASRSILLAGDYPERGRQNFYSFGTEKQVGLLSMRDDSDDLYDEDEARECPNYDKHILHVIRGTYFVYADIDNSGSSDIILQKMLDELEHQENPEAASLASEIDNWLQGREAARTENYEDALSFYSDAINLNGENPATLYERARVHIALGNYGPASEDLDRVVGIARQGGEIPPTPTPTLTQTPTETLTPTLTPSPTATPLPTATPSPTATPQDATATPSPTLTASPTLELVNTQAPTPTVEASEVPDIEAPPTTQEIAPHLPNQAPLPDFIRGFSNVGEIITAVRNLIEDNPELRDFLSVALISEYPNLGEIKYVPLETPLPTISEGTFEVQPSQLVRYTVNTISISWDIPNADFVRIDGLGDFTNNLIQSSTEYPGTHTLEGIGGIPSEALELTLYAEDLLGNSIEMSLFPPMFDPQCVALNDIALYEGPNERFQQVATVPQDTVIVVTAQDADSGWLRVLLPGDMRGWGIRELFACDSTFSITNLVTELNIPNLPTEIITTDPNLGTETPVAERDASATAAQRARDDNATATEQARPSDTPTRGSSPTPSPTPRFAGLRALRELSIRTGPSAAYREIRTIAAGEELEIVGQNGRWYQILLSTGTTGWVLNTPLFVDSFGPLDSVPAVEAATITPTPTNTPDRTATQAIIERITQNARSTQNAEATREQATQNVRATATGRFNATLTSEAQATNDAITTQSAIETQIALATLAALPGRMPYLQTFDDGEAVLTNSSYTGGWSVGRGADESSVLIGAARISEGFVLLGGGSPEWVESGITDYVLSFRVNMTAAEGAHVVFRYTEGRPYYALDITPGRINVRRGEGSDNPLTNRENEKFIGFARGYTTTMALDEWYDITIWMQGQHIYVFVDNDLIADAFDDNSPRPSGGDVMFQTLNRTKDIYFDDVIIQRANPASDHFESSSFSSSWNASVSNGEISIEDDVQDDDNRYVRMWRGAELATNATVADFDFRTRIYSEQGGYAIYLRESEAGAIRLRLDGGNMTIYTIDESGSATQIRELENFYNRGLWEDMRVRYVGDTLEIWMNGERELNTRLNVSLPAGQIRFETVGTGATADILRIDDFLLIEPIPR